MTIRYDSDGDGAAQALAEHTAAMLAAEARSLSGEEVRTLRAAIEDAHRVLSTINTRGMRHQHARMVEVARASNARASDVLARPIRPPNKSPAA